MNSSNEIEALVNSQVPIIIIESHEEIRVSKLIGEVAARAKTPLYKWSVTSGLQRMDIEMPPQKHNSDPEGVLRHISSIENPGIFILNDFHPFLDNPVHVRLLKDIAIRHEQSNQTVVLLSHEVEVPSELAKLSATANIPLPTKSELDEVVRKTAKDWAKENGGQVKADRETLDMLLNNLSGLTHRDARTLVRRAVFDDGAITQTDLPKTIRAKYELLGRDGVLSFEHDTAHFSEVGGFSRLKNWLSYRKEAFYSKAHPLHTDKPKGMMLLGVQGCGKSLAAKAVAGLLAAPLLRLDFGTLYNKFHGETERNLRNALKTAEAMSPCVLWIDEIEKGIATENTDGGTSRRVLATLLTWMAEKESSVFIVSTANDITSLPPELVRKGRFDEIFFVDLPELDIRKEIFEIHLSIRGLSMEHFNAEQLALASEGFSGAEIEQAVVSAQYTAYARNRAISNDILLEELAQTRPLSIIMAEKVAHLRAWAKGRTVPCD
ncbi:AAA family ATPase [Motiliproteus sp. SC1-56]|uniref:AAA family ATPase n=1 Tax=Motiliproteus sp. SC1-56 TaxID=2799565 RepID=UPI001A8CE92C|nr:AAA family ATPase [Motiliproteus sp. SC1-56]